MTKEELAQALGGIYGGFSCEIENVLNAFEQLQQENQHLKEKMKEKIHISENEMFNKFFEEYPDGDKELDKYKSVLDEIREHTKIGITTYQNGGSRTAMFEVFDTINEILDKVGSNE